MISGFSWLFGNFYFDEKKRTSSSAGNGDHQFNLNQPARTPEMSNDEASDTLYETIAGMKQQQQGKIWTSVKSIGSRIWDGIKRAWRFFKALFKKVAIRIAGWIRNLARMAFKYAVDLFNKIKIVVRKVTDAIEYILPRINPDSDPEQVTIQREAGFDYNLFVNQFANAPNVEQTTTKLSKQASIFQAGVKLVILVVRSIVKTVKRVVAGGGWFQLIMSFVKVVKEFRHVESIVAEVEAG